MNVEIICVGTELLLGDILNTNAKFLSQKLAEMGFNVYSQSIVGDNAERLENQINLSLSRSDIIILSGGLGPTEDDITKETVAKVLNLPLEMDEETLQNIKSYFKRTGRVMSENNKKQALKIKDSVLLKNLHGTAPGAYIESSNGTIILLPGPPSELVPMFKERVVPLLKKFSSGTIFSRNVCLFGIGESAAAEHCGRLLRGSNPTVATYAKHGEVDIRVTASAKTYGDARTLCNPVVDKLVEMFGDHVYGVDVDNLQQKVVETLRAKKLKLATAESCTAGMLSQRLTEVPGASEVFEMGVVAYANYVKVQALGVDQDIIDKKGAVSEEVAVQMAIGIRSLCGSDIGVGITGVAGPGKSENKPVGLVYIALADSKKVFVRKILSRGTDRDTTRILATSTALDMVRRYLENCEDFISFGSAYGEPLKLMEGYELVKNDPSAVENTVKEEPVHEEKKVDEKTYFLKNDLSDLFYIPSDDEDEKTGKSEKLEDTNFGISFVLEDKYYEKSNKKSIRSSYYYQSRFSKGKKHRKTKDINLKDQSNEQPKEKNKEKAKKTTTTEQKKKNDFWASFLPCKADSTFEKVRKSIFIVALVVLICTTIYLVNYFVEGWSAQQKISSAAEDWSAEGNMQKNENDMFIGFEALQKQNDDIRAWIEIDGTNINNPVYQTSNNDYYLDHDMTKQKSRYGALFIDKNAKIEKDYNSQNVVIYGHHMKDGTMFASLKKYTDINYYKAHPVIDFTTLYRDGQYKVFGVFIVNTVAEHDNGEVFDYRKHQFISQKAFLEFVDEVKKRSIIDTNVDVIEDDEIITLSTCTYEFEEARLVVMARRVRENEIASVNTSNAKVNKKPLYPQIWYDMKGGKKPVFESEIENSSLPTSSFDVSGTSSVLEQGSDVVSGFNAGTTSVVSNSSTTQLGGQTTSTSNTANNTTSKAPATSSNISSTLTSNTPQSTSSKTPQSTSSNTSVPTSSGVSSAAGQ